LQTFKGCDVVHINCKCVKMALLHRTCRVLQSAEHQSTTIASISPLSVSIQSDVRLHLKIVSCRG